MKDDNKIRLAISIGCLDIGGAEVLVVNLLKKMDYRIFDVLLIVLSKRYNTFLEKDVENIPIQVIYLNKKEGFKPFLMMKITKILRKFKPDILHGNIGGLIYMLLYLLFSKVKCIHTVHTLNEFSKFKINIIKTFYKNKKIIPVAISKSIVHDIKNNYKVDDINLISNGIDVDKYYFKRSYSFEKITIGHIGRFEKVKNHQTIIEVYNILKDKLENIFLYLVGNGTLYNKYYQLLENDNCVVIKKCSDKVNEDLKNIDIFLFPSICEGFPIALIEALASGCVVIASNIGGVNEIIEDGVNGFLIDDCFNTEKFVHMIIYLINNNDKMLEMSKNNIEKAKKYDVNTMANLYQRLYIKEANRC